MLDAEHMYAIRTGDASMLDEKELEAHNELLKINSEIISADMTDIEKIKAAHDYLILNAAYDHDHVDNYCGLSGANEDCHYVEGTLLNKLAVCSGYASAFRLLMTLQGIHCDYVTSDIDNHGWNVVELDGEWYQLDVTWDDPDNGNALEYEYFMATNAEIEAAGGHRYWECECGVQHDCSSTKYRLYPYAEYLCTTEEEAKIVISNQTDSDVITFVYPKDSALNENNALLWLCASELGWSGSISYYAPTEIAGTHYVYKVLGPTATVAAELSAGLLWKDPAIGVEWPVPEGMTEADLLLSERDTKWGGIEEYKKERGLE